MNKTIRCKFVCQSVTISKGDTENPLLYTADLYAVHNDSPENKEFFKWTPSGKLILGVYRNADAFAVGKEYYIDISVAAPIEA